MVKLGKMFVKCILKEAWVKQTILWGDGNSFIAAKPRFQVESDHFFRMSHELWWAGIKHYKK